MNLSNHLRRRHAINIDIPAPKAASISGSDVRSATPNLFGQLQSLPENTHRAKAITASIARFICKDMCPYSVVENTGFREMINTLEPRYKIPSRQFFSEKCIPELYRSTKEELQLKLSQSVRVALTTDSWTSCSTESYVTITAHLISMNWQMQSFVLQTRTLNEAHTGKNIGELLRDACSEWTIADKSPALVTDNARNMIVAGKVAGFTPHITCFAHTLNLVSQKAMKVSSAEQLLGKVRRIVSLFHRSSTATCTLKEKQQILGLPVHKLKQDVCTRWNSSVEMLERFLEQQTAILATLMSKDLRRGTEVHTLTETDISNAEDIVKVMAPIKIATTMMCEEEQPTVSVIAPLQAKLLKHLEPCEDDTDMTREIKSTMTTDFSSRYTNSRDILLKASALDPRFKGLPFLENEEREFVFTKLTVDATNSIQVEQQEDAVEEKPPDTAEEDEMRPAKKLKAMDLLFGNIFQQVPETCPLSRSASVVSRDEVLKYRSMVPLPLTENALDWWKSHETELPILANLARSCLCIPATSVASERVFSTAGDIVSSQRSSLQPDCVDQFIFLKKKSQVDGVRKKQVIS
ncbi:E3 SUMO-protein ligase ZBED1 [Labeo rohita]|uniref:E3 SUMO-protein ligase ZBED1 n=1 Tax=Labeo rohita TaxID=84645 RepID=A0ABQ8L591_LABRO|nr:E3 SUMO-protein ligase ZBED1 [Labeo rohita]